MYTNSMCEVHTLHIYNSVVHTLRMILFLFSHMYSAEATTKYLTAIVYCVCMYMLHKYISYKLFDL